MLSQFVGDADLAEGRLLQGNLYHRLLNVLFDPVLRAGFCVG